jgi:HlyD family secretion protein
MARKHPPKPVIGLLVLALVGGGAYWWVSTHPAPVKQGVSGVIEARQYQVASVLAGRITEIKVHEGDTVKAGQPVVMLDAAPLDLGVKQAQAGVEAANAALKQAKDDDKSTAEIAAATAKVTQAQAAVDLAKVQVSYATINAPHAGTVTTVTTNAGQNAAPGKTLLTIIDPAESFVRVFVPEPQLGSVKVGKVAHVTAGGKAFDGSVTFVASDAEFTPNNVETADQRAKLVYEVRVTLPDTGGVAKPGLPADVTFA